MGRSTQNSNATQGGMDMSPFVDALLSTADELAEVRKSNVEQTKANRDMLRALLKQGVVSDEQATKIREHYPEREKKEKTGDDAAPATDDKGGDAATTDDKSGDAASTAA